MSLLGKYQYSYENVALKSADYSFETTLKVIIYEQYHIYNEE